MIKTVGLFELPTDLDPDLFWRQHVISHADEIARQGGDLLKGYVISRVASPLVGDPRFWGMVELWFEDEAARAEFDRVTDESRFGEAETHFEQYVRNFSAVEVQSHVVITPEDLAANG
ncbi:MAG: hypothetical protein QM638_02920 [Nocardioides sp.]|uniref:hypothetical protein n=1 Tax=Nocardioides sp. TaxID=35761 RepID=UPI0039E21833